ncbi:hypothetical protein MCEMIH22_01311 [Candidatus Methylacidiphilaceae bacterium]
MSNTISWDSAHEFEKYLNSINWLPGKTKNHQSFCAALRSVSLGISADIAFNMIQERIIGAGGTFIPHKVERDIRRAAGAADKPLTGGLSNRYPLIQPKAAFDPNALRKKVSHLKDFNVVEMLAQRSIRPPSAVKPHEFLSSVFNGGERIRVFTETHVGQGLVFIAGDNALPIKTDTQAGAWFLSHPVDGKAKINDEGNPSYRSHQNGTRFPYLVLETDDAPEHEWLALLASLDACIVAITHSGKRGAHGLLKVDCNTWEEVQATAARIKPDYVRLGACPGALRAGLTRLPGFMREGREQKLLFLRPRTSRDKRPILELEPTALCWKRLAVSIIEAHPRGDELLIPDQVHQVIKNLEDWNDLEHAAELRSILDSAQIEKLGAAYLTEVP